MKLILVQLSILKKYMNYFFPFKLMVYLFLINNFMHQNSQIMKNYGPKIEHHHDEFDLQFIKPEKWFMRKHLIEKQAHRLDYMLMQVSTPLSTKTRMVNRATFISQALRFHVWEQSILLYHHLPCTRENSLCFRYMHPPPHMRGEPHKCGVLFAH